MKEKNIQGVFSLESLMKRQLAALVHCVRRTALMRVTDMTGTMTKRITGGIINASINRGGTSPVKKGIIRIR